MEWLVDGLRNGIAQMTWLEATAVFFGLLSVWYAKQENILVYPTGIVSVLIYVHICYGAKLYADMGINAYYFVMSVYGWIVWAGKNNDRPAVPISFNTARENVYSLLLFVISYLVLFYTLKEHTDSDVPSWDAFTTAVFFVGMWLMAKKKVENWVAWIIGDLASVPLYFYKGLILTSIQYLVFTALAVAGLIAWMNTIKKKGNYSRMRIKRIAIIGPESTGKSTLSEDLAKRFGTFWVPEYAREYLENLGRPYGEADLLEIAKGQKFLEDKLTREAKEYLFCDTTLVVIKVWSEHKYGRCHPWILEQLSKMQYDYFLLTDIDLPWEQDPLREHPHMRKYFFDLYHQYVQQNRFPYQLIKGNREERLELAISAMDRI